MKTKTFSQLDATQRAAAIKRVDAILIKMARESGRMCMDSTEQVATGAVYTMTNRGWIWGITFADSVRWATEEYPKKGIRL